MGCRYNHFIKQESCFGVLICISPDPYFKAKKQQCQTRVATCTLSVDILVTGFDCALITLILDYWSKTRNFSNDLTKRFMVTCKCLDLQQKALWLNLNPGYDFDETVHKKVSVRNFNWLCKCRTNIDSTRFAWSNNKSMILNSFQQNDGLLCQFLSQFWAINFLVLWLPTLVWCCQNLGNSDQIKFDQVIRIYQKTRADYFWQFNRLKQWQQWTQKPIIFVGLGLI